LIINLNNLNNIVKYIIKINISINYHQINKKLKDHHYIIFKNILLQQLEELLNYNGHHNYLHIFNLLKQCGISLKILKNILNNLSH
jgi:hypothetical protein